MTDKYLDSLSLETLLEMKETKKLAKQAKQELLESDELPAEQKKEMVKTYARLGYDIWKLDSAIMKKRK